MISRKKAPPGSLDALLKRTFFAGRYKEAIKELEQVAGTTDNQKDRARALLFIGRSYIELKQYRRSISYLVDKDVTRFLLQ